MESKSGTRKKPPKIEEMTKEQIRVSILKKRETTARAQRVVESLLEPGTSEEQLLRSLPHLNQCHLDDVVEERAITLLCGYPPCVHRLSKDIPKQQYRISIKTNKVYDITERKNFCSNLCYKATLYVKNQMLTSPLWFREHEHIPIFHLMPSDELPTMGQAIDLSLVEKIHINIDRKTNFTSINDFAGASLNDLESFENGTGDNNNLVKHEKCSDTEIKLKNNHSPNDTNIPNPESSSVFENIDEKYEKQVQKIQPIIISEDIFKLQPESVKPNDETDKLRKVYSENDVFSSKSEQKRTCKTQKPLAIIGEVIEHPEKKIDPIITSSVNRGTKILKSNQKKIASSKKDDKIINTIIYVEKCVAEWFTLDSMILLLGEMKVKEMVADKGDCIKEYLNNMANSLFYSSTSYDQYQELCRKLNILELEDHRYDSRVFSKETKPLPDYSIIKEEGKRMELKVRAFLSGETEIPEPSMTQKPRSQEDDSSNLTQLALVDKKAQNALRRKILLTNLNKVLNDLQCSIGLQGFSITSDVRLLVNSFKLKANNIMFKPIQWTLIGMIIIKLLSLRDNSIRQALESPVGNRNLQLLLLSYKQDGGYLDRLVLWLTDIDRLLDTSHTQLTVQI